MVYGSGHESVLIGQLCCLRGKSFVNLEGTFGEFSPLELRAGGDR